MPRPAARSVMPTHEVTNQPPPPGDADLWADDPVLRTHARGADAEALAGFGAAWGTRALREAGRAANRHPPELQQFDAGGRRLDEVAFHPAWHALMAEGLGAGYAALPWEGAPGGHATHAAMVYMATQADPGVCCPMTMTYAAVPALRADAALDALWRPRLLSRDHDPRVLPLAEKRGATMGMAMTEKQGGSDLRTTATRAEPADGHWRLTGHKWFCSAPMSDGFLTLAQAPGGLTCFLVPRWLEGDRNAIRLLRLKDKLGNRSNASAEIEYEGALAHRLGPEGEGVRTILEMVHHTRLDTAVAPAGLMRAALAEAARWTAHRTAFQRRLIDQPLMRAVLADLVLDWEGAAALAFRVARAFDAPADRALARLGVALAKYLNTRALRPGGGRGDGSPGRHGLRGGHGPPPPLARGAAQRHLGRRGQRHLPRHPAHARARPRGRAGARGRTRCRQGRLARLRHGARAPPHALAGAPRGGRGALVRGAHGAPPGRLGPPAPVAARGGGGLRGHPSRG
jgi:putative acyl-CoA dehydrogenase